ncbi:hypothetical protein LCGC14_2076520, partial [marine sediment metagenome]
APTRWCPGGIASPQYTGSIPRTTSPLQELRFSNWMDEELRGTPAFYPDVLISYYYFRDISLQLPRDGFVFGDSGGFSIRKFGMARSTGPAHQRRVDPVDVLRWQAKLCDVGVILDSPPKAPGGELVRLADGVSAQQGSFNAHTWEYGITTTLKNTKRALPFYEKLRKENNPFRWWGVIQGLTNEQRDIWWKEVGAVYPFTDEGEGWAIRMQPVSFNPVYVAQGLRWLQQHKITHTHFLAAASPLAVATIIVLGERAGLEVTSCDSTAGTIHAINRSVVLPSQDGMGYSEIEEKRGETQGQRFLLEKCPCISCAQLREDQRQYPDLLSGEYNEYWLHRFIFHNLIVFFNIFRTVAVEAKTHPDHLLRTILGPRYGNVLRAFDGRESVQTAEGMPRSLTEWL